jgi:protocatechuate 3,4-dioxygenase beta subunit
MTERDFRKTVTRRDTLRLLGATGAIAFVGWRDGWATRLSSTTSAAPRAAQTFDCVAKPSLTEGPYFVDERLNRSDIRSDPITGVVKQGILLNLTFDVHRLGDDGSCSPLPGAYVDIWHCDADGSYSDVAGEGTSGQKYLRGYQMTDQDGVARFATIFPGWYRGRTVHIHFKVRTFSGNQTAYEYTSQLFFSQSDTARVFSQSPYSRNGSPDTTNSEDGIYGQSGGQLTLELTEDGSVYNSTFALALTGVPVTDTGDAPVVTGATISGKKLIVTGTDFGSGAAVRLNGDTVKTRNDATSPTTVLVVNKAKRKIARGATVTLQVQNPDGALSNEFAYTRPA